LNATPFGAAPDTVRKHRATTDKPLKFNGLVDERVSENEEIEELPGHFVAA